MTLHQGAIEDIFCESMQMKGLEVERGTFPTSLVLTDNTATLMDSDAYTAEVVSPFLPSHIDAEGYHSTGRTQPSERYFRRR